MAWDGHEDFGDLEIRDNGELSEEEEGEELVGLDFLLYFIFVSAINFTFYFFHFTIEFSQFRTNSNRVQTLPPGGNGTKS